MLLVCSETIVIEMLFSKIALSAKSEIVYCWFPPFAVLSTTTTRFTCMTIAVFSSCIRVCKLKLKH